MSAFKIDKGIPVPPDGHGGRIKGTSKYPFVDMKIDDSFFVPDAKQNSLHTIAASWGKRLGRKFITRKVTEPVTNQPGVTVTGIRVWRTE
ncbi:MAG: hypothetical protein KGL39_03990 [Patescibacteria group bacterium]|nr:hypothetical protein [Patescibacteria group bacterium]